MSPLHHYLVNLNTFETLLKFVQKANTVPMLLGLKRHKKRENCAWISSGFCNVTVKLSQFHTKD